VSPAAAIPVLLALAASYGVYLVYTAVVYGWTGVAPRPVPAVRRRPVGDRLRDWMVQAGLGDTRPRELAGVVGAVFLLGAVVAWAIFGAIWAALAGGAFAATFPVAATRSRRDRRRALAQEAWPRLIEEIRIKTTSLGRSIPQAVLEVGMTAPEEMRPAFEAARREWLISTDFDRTLAVLKDRLADATADTVCETLLVAHEIGGNEIDRCLNALVDDRVMDVQGRKDARSKQAGARFTRVFVIIMPVGMALIGLRIGSGRAAFQTSIGQVLVMAGIACMALCWVWASAIMRLPQEERIFHGGDASAAGGGR
jgi:tight adherence protein B